MNLAKPIGHQAVDAFGKSSKSLPSAPRSRSSGKSGSPEEWHDKSIDVGAIHSAFARRTSVSRVGALRRWAPAAIATLAATIALTAMTAAPPADAAARRARPARPTEATAPRAGRRADHGHRVDQEPAGDLLRRRRLDLRAPVSTGMTGRETPAGVFAVIEKDKDHHSSLYDDAWMPNMLRITWNGIALHGGPLPGYAASHGCVRMPYDFAEKMFDKTPMGMRVIISPSDAEPVAFSHPSLFVPKQEAIDAAPARAEALAREADEATKAAAAAKTAVATGKARGGRRAAARAQAHLEKSAPTPSSPMPRRCSPPPRRTKPRPRREGRDGAEGRRQSRGAAHAARGRHGRPKTKQDAVAAAEAAAKTAEAKRSRPPRPRRTPSSHSSRSRSTSAARRGSFTCGATRMSGCRTGARGTTRAVEVPVTIKDPDKPIGTHIFTAVARTERRLALDRSHDRQRR